MTVDDIFHYVCVCRQNVIVYCLQLKPADIGAAAYDQYLSEKHAEMKRVGVVNLTASVEDDKNPKAEPPAVEYPFIKNDHQKLGLAAELFAVGDIRSGIVLVERLAAIEPCEHPHVSVH